jgi:hypothetical protein
MITFHVELCQNLDGHFEVWVVDLLPSEDLAEISLCDETGFFPFELERVAYLDFH